ncbi:MAG: VCBS repeat-containing protein [Candidatus Eisenbacteria bacterium]
MMPEPIPRPFRSACRASTHPFTRIALPLLGVVLGSAPWAPVQAQSFTRITTGAAVNDGGGSRAVVWVDYDGDGDLDLFVSNGPDPGEPAFLYRNDGAPDWTFTKITDQPIVQDAARADGATFGDCDNDGDLDAVVVTWYNDLTLFYRGNGAGGFVKDITDPIGTTRGFSESCSWGDYDGDGAIDLYLANSGNAVAEANRLFHQTATETFTQVSLPPATSDARRTRGVTWADYDNDGDLDIFGATRCHRARTSIATTGVPSLRSRGIRSFRPPATPGPGAGPTSTTTATSTSTSAIGADRTTFCSSTTATARSLPSRAIRWSRAGVGPPAAVGATTTTMATWTSSRPTPSGEA